MARKQKELPGLEKQVENPAIEEAAEKYVEILAEHNALSKKKTDAMRMLLAQLKTHGLKEYEFADENGEILIAKIKEGKETAIVESAGESAGEVELEAGDSDAGDDDGLVVEAARAKKAQHDVNVETDDDGDVVVPETAAPKKKSKRAAKASVRAAGVH